MPEGDVGIQTGGQVFLGGSSKLSVPLLPLGHGFKSQVLKQFRAAIGSSHDFVDIARGTIGSFRFIVVILVKGLPVEKVDVGVASLEEMESGTQAKDTGPYDDYLGVFSQLGGVSHGVVLLVRAEWFYKDSGTVLK